MFVYQLCERFSILL